MSVDAIALGLSFDPDEPCRPADNASWRKLALDNKGGRQYLNQVAEGNSVYDLDDERATRGIKARLALTMIRSDGKLELRRLHHSVAAACFAYAAKAICGVQSVSALHERWEAVWRALRPLPGPPPLPTLGATSAFECEEAVLALIKAELLVRGRASV